MRLAFAALNALLLFPGAALAKTPGFPPEIPDTAGFVLHVPKPAALLEKVEALAAAAGLAPPGTEPGWLKAQLPPEARDVDLSKPVWLGFEENGDDDRVVAIFEVRGKGEALAAQAQLAGGQLTKKGARWVARKGPASLKGKAKVKMPRADGALAGSDALMWFASDDLNADLDLGSRGILGLQIGPGGLNLLVQVSPEPGSSLAKLGPMKANTTEPLITGLPPGDYALVVGSRGDAKHAKRLQELRRRSKPKQKTSGSAEVDEAVRALLDVVLTDGGDCDQGSMGVSVTAGQEPVQILGQGRCSDAEAAVAAITKSTEALTQILGMALAAGDDGPRVSAMKNEKPRKVGGLSLRGVRMDLRANDELPPALRSAFEQPLWYGTVDKRTLVFAVGAGDATIETLAATSKQGKPTAIAGLEATRAKMFQPRMVEGFLRIAPIAAAFLPPELAPMRFLLGSIPPLGFSGRALSDGGVVMQLWLPQEIAQLAAAVAQMMPSK